jgi:hypothetical protein
VSRAPFVLTILRRWSPLLTVRRRRYCSLVSRRCRSGGCSQPILRRIRSVGKPACWGLPIKLGSHHSPKIGEYERSVPEPDRGDQDVVARLEYSISFRAVRGGALHKKELQTAVTPTLIARFGEWELAEDLNSEDKIGYRATLHDHVDKNRYLQIQCWPSEPNRVFTFWPIDGAIKDQSPRRVLVTLTTLG